MFMSTILKNMEMKQVLCRYLGEERTGARVSLPEQRHVADELRAHPVDGDLKAWQIPQMA